VGVIHAMKTTQRIIEAAFYQSKSTQKKPGNRTGNCKKNSYWGNHYHQMTKFVT
jgi:hypothetical protein